MLGMIQRRIGTREYQWGLAATMFGLGKAINFLALLVSVPLSLDYLGKDGFGLWVVASSSIAFFTILEGGIGNGLILSVSNAVGKKDVQEVRRQFSSAFLTLVLLGAALLCPALIAGPGFDWSRVINVPSSIGPHEIGLVMLVLWLSFTANFPVSFLRHFRLGLQEGGAAAAWEMAASLSGFAGIIAAIVFDAGLVGLCAGAAGAPTFVRIIHFCCFLWRRPEFRPSLALVSKESILKLVRIGAPMWLISITFTVSMQLNIWLLGVMSELSEAAALSITQRYYMIAFVPVTIVFGTLLPALSEAASSGDSAWFKRRFLQISLCAVVGGGSVLAVMALNSHALMDLWLGGNMKPSGGLIAVMGVYYMLMLVQGACSTLLLALGKMKIQIITSVLSSVSSISLAVMLIPGYGAIGAALSSLAAFFVLLFIPQLLLSLRLLKKKSIHGALYET